jgi:ADP-heptose:LPS heptosyltransferase
MSSLLVKLPNWMGDILFSYDLLYSLSSQFERIAVCTSINHRDLFEIFPVPHTEVIAYPRENWPNLDRETIQKISDFQADQTLILPNSFGSALIMRYAGASHLCGYDTEHRSFLMHRAIPAPPFRIHQTEYYLRLLTLFDAGCSSYPLKNHSTRIDRVVMHPGASKIERAWHLERFLKLAEQFREQGTEVVLVSGDRISSNGFRTLVNPPLSEFSELLKTASLFVGNDSGPLHFAQQCGTPVVGIYGPGNPITTGPRNVSPNRVVYRAFPCSPCSQRYFKECEPSENQKPFCIETITVEEVWHTCSKLMKTTEAQKN